jgi:microcystin-dependent protein
VSYTSPNRTWIVGETVTASVMNQYVRDQLIALGRIGLYDYITSATAGYQVLNLIDNAWAECNHAEFSRSGFPEYDALLAGLAPVRPFGPGNGTSTTNVPDLFGRAPYGVGSHVDVNAFGDSDGDASTTRTPNHSHSLSGSSLPAHVHGVSDPSHSHGVNDPTHSHGITDGFGVTGIGGGPPQTLHAAAAATFAFSTNAATGISIQASGVGITIQNPTSSPAIGGVAGQGGTRSQDKTPYQICGIWVVKVKP